MGAYACLASQARGGWLVAPVLLLLAVWWQREGVSHTPNGTAPRQGKWLHAAAGLALLAVLGLGLSSALPQQARIGPRLTQVWTEAQGFWQRGDAETSVGQRLAHWQLAWDMGWERPWLGWGDEGYEAEKARRAAAGEVPDSVRRHGHAHHELLDLWAHRGLWGLWGWAVFLGLPACIFWRRHRHWSAVLRQATTTHDQAQVARQARCAAVCGGLMVVGYVGFGQTQVMFAHNSGTMAYSFMMLVWLALSARRPLHWSPPSPQATHST